MRSAYSAPKRKLSLASLLLAFAVITTPCLAQQPQPDITEVSLEQLGQIQVYSASKHLQDTREAPSSVTVITADEIKQHGYRTLADILSTVREFYVTSDRNYSFVGFRGFGRPGDYNTRVLLLVDGHRINDNIYNQAMLGTEFPLDIALIDRVEVIRGPGSSLYGSNAFFAVINVISRKGHALNGWELSFEPGNFDTYKGRASYGGDFKGVEVLLSGSFYDSAGQTLFFPEFNSPNTNNGFAQNLDYDRFHDFLLNTSFRGFTLQGVTSRRDKGIPTAPFGTVFDDPRTHSVDQHQYLDLGYKSTVGPWEVGIRTYYDRYGYDGKWPFPAGELNVDYARGQSWGSELQLSRTVLRKHHLTWGGELRDNLQQDQKNYDTNPIPLVLVDSRRTSWMWAGFVQDEYVITHQLTLSAGVRYGRDAGYDSSTSPRLGLIYRPVKTTSFKVLYGTAFRTPNVFERYYGSTAPTNGQYLVNPDLQPESIKNIDLVWEQDLGEHLRLSTDLFRNYIDRLISLQLDPNTGLLMYGNTDKARSTGLGVELGGHFLHRLDASLSYSYTETEDPKTNQLLVNSPRHLGKFKVTAPLFRQLLFAGVDMQYEDSRRTLTGGYIPAFPLLNATLFGHAVSKHVDLSGSIYNLLGRKYFDVSPDEDRQTALQQDGRIFRLKLTWNFGAK